MQRVLYQLTELGTVWKGVLPASVYAASLGRLLDSVALEMVYRVEAVEDIAELTGPHLQVTRRAVQRRGLRAAPNVSLCVCVCVCVCAPQRCRWRQRLCESTDASAALTPPAR
jgi:hypothetical protein